MPSPFPGMDPYLEDSFYWHSFHVKLAPVIAANLNKKIGPKYYAEVEVYTVTDLVHITRPDHNYPDVNILEKKIKETSGTVKAPYLVPEPIPAAPVYRSIPVETELRLRSVKLYSVRDDEVITTIEILSPVNKRRGGNLAAYRKKRRKILASGVSLVELDLLRGGTRPGPEVAYPPLETDYVLLVNRATDTPHERISAIWPVAINEPLPVLPVPLLPEDGETPLKIGELFNTVYAESNYAWRINYQEPVPSPPLRPEMAAWLREHLPEVGQPAGS